MAVDTEKPKETEGTETERIAKLTEDLVRKKLIETQDTTNKEVADALAKRKIELAEMELKIDSKKKEVDGMLLELEKQGSSFAAKTLTADDKIKKEANEWLASTGMSI